MKLLFKKLIPYAMILITMMVFAFADAGFAKKKKKKSSIPKNMIGMTNAHNYYRKKAKVKKIKWSKSIAAYAQKWANAIKKKGCKMNQNPHRPKPWKYGENIAASKGYRWKPKQVVDMWHSEKKDYNHKKGTCAKGKQCGHYTQIIRKTTKAVGCGLATCGKGSSATDFWVCNYRN